MSRPVAVAGGRSGLLRREGRAALRLVAVWITATVTIGILDPIMAGFALPSWWQPPLIALLIGTFCALLWPLLMRVALGITVLTLGLGAFLLAGLVVLGAFLIVPGGSIRGLPTAVIIAAVLATVIGATSSVLALDEDEIFFRRISRRMRRRRRRRAEVDARDGRDMAEDGGGIVYLQIDGLGYDVLRRAMRDGNAPTLARWMHEGSHQLRSWHTDWSSQTGASVCAILHGSNDGVLGFRWYDKPAGRLMAVSHPADAAEIERAHSTGAGLLAGGGAARGNLFTGDAEYVSLTMSAPIRRKGRLGAGYYAYFANPINASRTAVVSVIEIGRELVAAARQRRNDVWPRVDRGGLYPFIRPATTVIARDVIVAAVCEDMLDGRPAIYADFLGYDEVGHHSGIERYDALDVLRSIDQQIGRLARASALAPRRYDFVILSDHGLTQGASFTDRFGYSFEELVRTGIRGTALPPDPVRDAMSDKSSRRTVENWQVRTARRPPRDTEAVGSVDTRTLDRPADPCADRSRGQSGQVATEDGAIIVYSGHLATVAFTELPGRATETAIEEHAPGLLTRIAEHPGVGFVLVRGADGRGQVLGRAGRLDLGTGAIEGTDPLADYGPYARELVTRTDGFDNCADLVVNAAYDPASEQSSAFEQHVASHGALGGPQVEGFLLYPERLRDPAGPIVGAAALHQVLLGWRAEAEAHS